MSESGLGQITGLWKSEKGYLSGSQGGVTYYVFKNDDASGNRPEYTLCVAKRKKKEDGQGSTDYSKVGPPPIADDDVPF